jgi:hypothetical protein
MAVEIETQEQIYSSTGELGATRRPDKRSYVNLPMPVDSLETIDFLFDRAARITRYPDTRAVVKGFVSDTVMSEIMQQEHHLLEHIEVAVPVITDSEGNPLWLTVFAKNGDNRKNPLVDLDTMITETSEYINPPTSVRKKMENVLNKEKKEIDGEGNELVTNYRFISQIPEEIEGQLYDLWHDTFGWSFDQITALRHRLNNQKKVQQENDGNTSANEVWFTGVVKREIKNGEVSERLVAACTAERLNYPIEMTENGLRQLAYVESTEWVAHESGVISAAVAVNNAQVIHDLGRETVRIGAECNFRSRADFVGNSVGMKVPPRKYRIGDRYEIQFDQIMVQNVTVRDGFQENPNGEELRDFTFLILMPDEMDEFYSAEDIKFVREQLDREEVINNENIIFISSQTAYSTVGDYQ